MAWSRRICQLGPSILEVNGIDLDGDIVAEFGIT